MAVRALPSGRGEAKLSSRPFVHRSPPPPRVPPPPSPSSIAHTPSSPDAGMCPPPPPPPPLRRRLCSRLCSRPARAFAPRALLLRVVESRRGRTSLKRVFLRVFQCLPCRGHCYYCCFYATPPPSLVAGRIRPLLRAPQTHGRSRRLSRRRAEAAHSRGGGVPRDAGRPPGRRRRHVRHVSHRPGHHVLPWERRILACDAAAVRRTRCRCRRRANGRRPACRRFPSPAGS